MDKNRYKKNTGDSEKQENQNTDSVMKDSKVNETPQQEQVAQAEFSYDAPESENLKSEEPPKGEDKTSAKKKSSKNDGKGPAYYYGSPSASTYGSAPYYSSSSSYGAGYYYGGSGSSGYYYGSHGSSAGYYYGSGNPHDHEDSIFGPISLLRIIRVTLLKWPTLIVSVVLGLAATFAYYKATPKSYKATSIIELSVKPTRVMNTEEIIINDPNAQGTTQEIFNTRLAMLRSLKVIKLVSDRVRSDYPSLKTMPDEDLYAMLKNNVELDIQKHSRLVTVSVRHNNPEIAQSIANAYAETAVTYSVEENKEAAESGVASLKIMKETHGRAVDVAANAILKFRQENQLDPMISERESLAQTYQKLSLDKVEADNILTADNEILSILTSIQQDPRKFSAIPGNTPRADEISQAQKELQDKINERDSLLSKYTAKHPSVEQINRTIEVLEKQYAGAVARSRDTAAANRSVSANRVETIQKMLQDNFARQQELGAKIAIVQSQLTQLEFAYENASKNYQAISSRMEEARISIDDSLATIRIIEMAMLPKHPFSPNPRIAFSVGAVLGLIIGFLFIMALDRVEDRITGSDDIKRHMNTTVLNLIPRIPRTKRTQLALLSATKKFSRIAEAFAGLRGLLESPRYANVSKVILIVSTQPEEGKTITASNLALSFALSGKKTLLVDFDLRRPRVARIYNIADQITSENNLIEVLDDPGETDFSKVPIDSGFENLDIVGSAVSSSISPANVIGSEKLRYFFDWVRANYDHVVIDSPPFGLVSDAIRLGSFSDAAMIVCRPNKSRFGLVRHAISALKESGSNVIGVVVNEVNFNQSNAFTSGVYNSYSNYSKNGKYGGRYGYGYGSYYKRTAKDDVAVIDTSKDDDEPEVSRQNSDEELDVDEE